MVTRPDHPTLRPAVGRGLRYSRGVAGTERGAQRMITPEQVRSISAEDLSAIISNLHEENKRLCDALEQYADQNNWDDAGGSRRYDDVWIEPGDGYAIARAVLKPKS